MIGDVFLFLVFLWLPLMVVLEIFKLWIRPSAGMYMLPIFCNGFPLFDQTRVYVALRPP